MSCFLTLPRSATRFQALARMRQKRANYANFNAYYQI